MVLLNVNKQSDGRIISKIIIPVATETLSEFTLPLIGSLTNRSHCSRTVFLMLQPSEPMTRANGTVRSVSHP